MQARLSRDVRQRLQQARLHLESIARDTRFRSPATIFEPMQQRIDDLESRLKSALDRQMLRRKTQVDQLFYRLQAGRPTEKLKLMRQRLAHAESRLTASISRQLSRHQQRLSTLDASLTALSPLRVLDRGYSITTRKSSGQVVRNRADVQVGEALVTRVRDGSIESVVRDEKQGRLFE
jgi:exodeoxyribonuclease VII large subunit